ncbi:DUF4288 domain-containing protein [Steroidobacter cummioxidans]|uniref:DUF4288 domain-containing protein n=1 Tax=Steroidobacter cummioxidans TaxID=1803913 RepID=UPI000E315BF3|nr:DUF4288 domain-containing protein [Steroidobacter cummioxidans]
MRDVSPVDWYVGTYQLRFVELGDKGNEDPTRRFLTWENTVLVKAKSLSEAHRKITRIGKSTRPYKGGPDAVEVQWVFEGVVELLPVYDEIEDGVEIMWGELRRSLKKIRSLAKRASEFKQHKTSPTSRSTRSRAKARTPG